ncbi:transposase [Streptomyces sp. NPDC051453]|uniref:transposase n=1 Tax=Streptomyces sp. NPDC051453 TaxID=3154941 RepID=UPI003445CA3D
MGADLSQHLVPDELWAPVAPLLPSFAARPQGGGIAACDERAVLTAVVYALTSGCAWRHVPPIFGTSPATAHRRFTVGTEAGCGVGCTWAVRWMNSRADEISAARRSARVRPTHGRLTACGN